MTPPRRPPSLLQIPDVLPRCLIIDAGDGYRCEWNQDLPNPVLWEVGKLLGRAMRALLPKVCRACVVATLQFMAEDFVHQCIFDGSISWSEAEDRFVV